MKKLSKIFLTVAIIMFAIICTSTIANAVTVNNFNLEISKATKEGNKITFLISRKKGEIETADVKYVLLNGDANNDKKIDINDVELVQNFILNRPIESGVMNSYLTDVTCDGTITALDLSLIKTFATKLNITLDGSLAEDSTFELVNVDSEKYKLIVTIPEDGKEGTIGITIKENTFKYSSGNEDGNIETQITNAEISSDLFNIKDEKTEKLEVVNVDEKDKDTNNATMTVTVNKELDSKKVPEGWTLSEDGKTLVKDIEKGTTEKISLVALDGDVLDYEVVSKLQKDGDSDEELKIVNKKEDSIDSNKVKVTITVNKKLDSKKIPEGWTLSEDGKTLVKNLEKGTTEKITLVSEDGKTLEYIVNAMEKDEANNGDKSTSVTKLPQTGSSNIIFIAITGFIAIAVISFIKLRKQ